MGEGAVDLVYFSIAPPNESLSPPFVIFKWGRLAGAELPIKIIAMPKYRSNPKTMHKAGQLRKEPTPAETKLWSRIRNDQLGVNFRRQHAIGRYIADFCSPKARLIIELDGSQHLEQQEYDNERTKYLNSLGYKVMRFWNNEVMNNIDGVILAILQTLEEESRKE
jgi:very-short-patch-repair endonuclease